MSKPVRLGKNDYSYQNSFNDRVEAWVLSHATLCLTILMIILIIAFVLVCFAICGVSATESGTQYNQFQNIV